jgi:SPP1 family predicted phage head-tail adaptor
MRAGKLDRTIVIERRTDDVGDGGKVEAIWTQHATRRAEVLEDTASASAGGAGEVTRATLRLRLRFMSDLAFDDRVFLDGVSYEIAAIAEIGRRKATEIELVRIGDARP